MRILAQGNPVVDDAAAGWVERDAQGNAQHTRDWSSRYHALATPPTHAAFIVVGSRMAGICAHCSRWAIARVFAAGRGLRGLAVRLPFIAFPAGVNAEGVMGFVNARGTRGGAAGGTSHRSSSTSCRPTRAQGQVLQVRLGLMESRMKAVASHREGSGCLERGHSGALGQCGAEGERTRLWYLG